MQNAMQLTHLNHQSVSGGETITLARNIAPAPLPGTCERSFGGNSNGSA
jgi:hypothetical protein